MKKWLESKIGKGVGIVLSCLAAAGMVASLLWMAAVSFVEPEDLLLDNSGESFFKSGTFRNLLSGKVQEELSFYGEMQVLDASGEIDRKVLVDILDFDDQEKITGKNVNGLAYTLGDLLDWNKKLEKADDPLTKHIIVCQKPYGGNCYYYIEDFRRQFEENKWTLGQTVDVEQYDEGTVYEDDQEYSIQGDQTIKQILDQWEEAGWEDYYFEYPDQISDKNGSVIYSSFWAYEGTQLEEAYQPQGASSLLEVVNEKQWDLGEIFSALSNTIQNIPEKMEHTETVKYEHTQGSNVQYLYIDLDQELAFSNNTEYNTVKNWRDSLEAFRQMGSYTILTKGKEGTEYDSNMNGSEERWRHLVESSLAGTVLGDSDYVFAVAVDTGLPIQDWLYTERASFNRNVGILKKAIGVCIASTVLFLASILWLTLSAGRSEKGGQVALNFFDKWKTEVSVVLVVFVWSCLLAFFLETGILQPAVFSEYLGSISGEGPVTGVQVRFYVFVVAVIAIVTDLFFLWGYLSLVRRCKARTLWKNSVLRVLLRQGKKVFFMLKDIPRKAAVLGVFLFIQAFLLLCLEAHSYGGGGFVIFCLVLTQAAGIGWIVKVAVEYQKIQKGVRRIAGGDIAWQIPTQGLTLDRKTLAENINHVGEGFDQAVEESLRSERLKTELITNVSHDIKTPLTSIINYVDLLKREQIPDEKVQGYLDILEKKSQQLKTLTEDVVEASKASTGNLNLEYEELDLVEMILQVNGEFQEKFIQQDLDLIQHLPEDPVVIRADGRRVWRILENIYQNVYKYAMPHTRVYVELEAESLQAVFTMKNISQQPLNISPDELTERFIRGDSSRNTQGSGLGLSIAKSLTELQAGEFKLYLDGDLFKVRIAFPLHDPNVLRS